MINKIFSYFKLNRIIWYLTASDVFTWGIFYVLSGLVGLYLSQKLNREAVEIVGIGLSVYTVARGLLQIPIGLITDRLKEDKDEIILLIFGNFLMGLPYILLTFINSEIQFYLCQAILGIGSAINLISWRKLFAKNLDKDKEGIAYGVYDTIISLCTAFFGTFLGVIAGINSFFFDLVIFISGILISSSWIWAVLIYIYKKENENIHRN